MNVGTKSVLFGVHQFLWHPMTVALAFCRVHRRLPSWWEAIGIATHDLGYWGCTDMDGDSGINHPQVGARLAARIVGIFSEDRACDVYFFCLYHSSSYARRCDELPSALYLPDKVSILFDPAWFYLFRARLSGELDEYVMRECLRYGLTLTDEAWLKDYRARVQEKLTAHKHKP